MRNQYYLINFRQFISRLPWLTLGLIALWMLVLTGLPKQLPTQAASWLTFLGFLVTPGFCLAQIITGNQRLDWLERLALAFPFSIAILAVPGTIALVQHATLDVLVLGWGVTSGLIIIAWAAHGWWVRRLQPPLNAAPWTVGEGGLLLILAAIFAFILPALDLYKIDGDAYAVNSFAADALAGLPLNAREPLFGTDLGPGVRMLFNQALSMQFVWSYLSGIDQNTLIAAASRPMLALWGILAAYTLGKGAGSRRLGLLVAGLQLLILITGPFQRGDNISLFYFERTNADKFMVPLTMLPVVFAFGMHFLRHGRRSSWLTAAVVTFAVSTIHPLIAAMLALALGAFGGLHLLLGLRVRLPDRRGNWFLRLKESLRHAAGLDRRAARRSLALWGLVPLVMLLPILQLIIARGEAPLAPSYPRTFDGWPIGYRSIPALPFLEMRSLDLFGPPPDLSDLTPEDAYEPDSPFLLWRFAVNMNRRRLIIFERDQYISDPNILLEIPYLLALLTLPLLIGGMRRNLGAQLAVSTALAVLLVMFNPALTPLIGSLVMPWILWRFIWLLPYALMLALPLDWGLNRLAALLGNRFPHLNPAHPRHALTGYLTLAVFLLLGLGLSSRAETYRDIIIQRTAAPVFYPAPPKLMDRLAQLTGENGPSIVLADEDLSITIPAFVANANVVAHRVPNTSEVFPADKQAEALQRLIDQHTFFNTPYLTTESLETLHRHQVNYIVTSSGNEIDTQLRLSPQWFTWLLDDQSYSLYQVSQLPVASESIQGNDAMAGRQWDRASGHFEAELNRQPNDNLARFGQAKIAQSRGNFEEALRGLQALAKQTGLPHLDNQLGLLYGEMGRSQASIAAFDQAQQAAPHIARFHQALGDACLSAGNEPCATEQYALAATTQSLPNESARLIAEADFWRDQQRLDQAIPRYEQAVVLNAGEFNRFALQNAYLDAGRYTDAYRVVQQLKQDTPFSAEVRAIEARLNAAQGNFEAALAHYRHALRLQTWQGQESTDIRLELVQLLLDLNQHEAATETLDQALRAQPYNPVVHRLQGDLHQQRQEFEQAISAYQRAFQLDPTRIATYFALSDELRQQGSEPATVQALLQTAIRINPNEATLYIALGDQRLLQGDAPAAIEIYQLALNRFDSTLLPPSLRQQTIGQSRAFIFARLARVHENLGQLETAMNYYQATLSADPGAPWAKILLGDALHRRNDLAAAEAVYRQVIQDHPAQVDAYTRLAGVLYAQNKETTARQFSEQALQIALAQFQQQQPAGSRRQISPPGAQRVGPAFGSDETLDQIDPVKLRAQDSVTLKRAGISPQVLQVSGIDATLSLARLYQSRGYTDQAIQLYEQRLDQARAANESPILIAQFLKNLADLYQAKNAYRQAAITYQEAIRLNGWWPEARLGLAEALLAQGQSESALRELQTLSELAPGSVEAQISLANALTQVGRRDEALTIYQQTADRYPGNLQASLALAQALRDHNHLPEAEARYRQAMRQHAGRTEATIGLADLLLNQQDFEGAAGLLHQAIQIDHQSIDAYLRLGDLARQQGDAAAALDWYRQAIALPIATRSTNLNLLDSLLTYGDTETVQAYIAQILTYRANDSELLLRLAAIQRQTGQINEATRYPDPGAASPTRQRATPGGSGCTSAISGGFARRRNQLPASPHPPPRRCLDLPGVEPASDGPGSIPGSGRNTSIRPHPGC